jgi:hypothetical protein
MACSAVVGTAAFGGLATAATHTKAATTEQPSLAAPDVAPQQSFSPPIARSGGS